MKGLPKRLLFYAIGLGLGTVLAVFFVRGKYGGELPKFCYLPNCRVLKELRSKPISVGAVGNSCALDSLKIEEILTEGTVRFRLSNPRNTPCGEYTVDHQNYRLRVSNCRDSVHILQASCDRE